MPHFFRGTSASGEASFSPQLVLAPTDATDDGRLRVEDISKLALGDKAVVLASCSTSAGVVHRSERLMSLSRPFLAAGAQAVVGTLRRVRDTESANFFDEFYAALERGDSLGGALTAAKRARIRANSPAADWSDFILLGNAASTPRRSSPPRLTAGVRAGIGFCVAVALLAAFGLRRRRRADT